MGVQRFATYRQIEGKGPDKMQSTGPPGWGVGHRVKHFYYGNSNKDEPTTTMYEGLTEPSQDARMNVRGEKPKERRCQENRGHESQHQDQNSARIMMYETGSLSRNATLYMQDVNDSRWTGSGRLRNTTGKKALYSGRDVVIGDSKV